MSRLIDKIRKHIVEEGECWNWTGALQSCGSVPTMNHNGRVGAVRRFILEERGMLAPNQLATYTCGNPMCVNPDHVDVASRRMVQLRSAKELGYQANPLRRKRLSDNARKRAKITMEIAEAIRAAEGTQRERALRFGVSQSTVSRIVLGTNWINYKNPFAGLIA